MSEDMVINAPFSQLHLWEDVVYFLTLLTAPNIMAKRSSKKKRSKVILRKGTQPTNVSKLRQMIRSVRWTESYTSLLMGIVVVVVAVLFIVSFLKQTHHIQQTSSTSTVAVTISPTLTPTTGSGSSTSELKPSQKIYTVQAGDDLWHIAEKYYKSGYNWVDIAKTNNLSDPSMIFSGNLLIIPNVTPQIATITATPTPQTSPSVVSSTNPIKGDAYTVQSGDDLWSIAVRAYADGYQWVKIAQANNLANPDLIFSGNVLKIPQ